jgi:hypothetical protein
MRAAGRRWHGVGNPERHAPRRDPASAQPSGRQRGRRPNHREHEPGSGPSGEHTAPASPCRPKARCPPPRADGPRLLLTQHSAVESSRDRCTDAGHSLPPPSYGVMSNHHANRPRPLSGISRFVPSAHTLAHRFLHRLIHSVIPRTWRYACAIEPVAHPAFDMFSQHGTSTGTSTAALSCALAVHLLDLCGAIARSDLPVPPWRRQRHSRRTTTHTTGRHRRRRPR